MKLFKKIKLPPVSPASKEDWKQFKTQSGGLTRGWLDQLHEFSAALRHKLSNIPETNYNLGLKHYCYGNLDDAIMRFRIILHGAI